MVIDLLASKLNVAFDRGVDCLMGLTKHKDDRVILVKPQTFMNDSGRVLKRLYENFNVSTDNLLVVHDDLDLSSGRVKIQYGGGDGGHRGVRSIINCLADNQFTRVRIGVGRQPDGMTSADYVLEPILKEAQNDFVQVAEHAVDAVRCLVSDGRAQAMGHFNAYKE